PAHWAHAAGASTGNIPGNSSHIAATARGPRRHRAARVRIAAGWPPRLRRRSSWATSSETAHRNRTHPPARRARRQSPGQGMSQDMPEGRRKAALRSAWSAPQSRRLSQHAAVAVIDVPAVEAGNAEFNIVAEPGKALAIFDQIPDRPVTPI